MNITLLLPKFNRYNTKTNSVPMFKQNNLEKSPNSDSFEMTIGYVNDLHGQTNNMMRILSGLKGDLVLSAGDNDIGDEKNRAVHDATAKFLNLAKVRGTALGNHEMDTLQSDLEETSKKLDGDIYALNINQIPLEEQPKDEIDNFNKVNLSNFIKKSGIINVKGESIGILGLTPVDLAQRCSHPDYHKDCTALDLEKTIDAVQQEVNNLKANGINKIILLSHNGLARDKELASKTEGIDVIIGGHTHELIKGIAEGENLVYSKSGEPVIITEAGKDGKYFGELKLSFDDKGIISKAQNNIGDTSLYSKNLIHQYMFDKILGKPEVVGEIKYAPPASDSLLNENPHANFMCDAMCYEMDAEIGIWNNSGTRNYFKAGIIDTSDINEIAPFADNISVAEVSEKTLVDAFKKAVEVSYNSIGHKPGLLAVSGLNYTVSPSKKKLTGMNFVDKNGQEHKIDIDNPNKNKKYKVVADSFIMSWGKEYNVLAKEDECVEYPFNKAYLTSEYIKHLNRPVIINQTGRIRYEN